MDESASVSDHTVTQLLHKACTDGNLAKVKYLVEMLQFDPNVKDKNGNTALNLAALSGSLEIIEYLINDRKCTPECRGQYGRTILHNVCQVGGSIRLVRHLVEEYNCDPFVKDVHGNTPLNVAALSGHLSIVTYLIEEKHCTSECTGQWSQTPLHNACQGNALDVVKYLVEKCGCSTSKMDGNTNTALNVAARSGSLNVLKYLIEDRNCSSKCTGQLKRSLLHNACEGKSNLAVVKYLVEKHELDPLKRDKKNDTSLNIAASSSSLDILKYFIFTRNCGSRYTGHLGRTLLHNACEEHGSLATVKYLENGYDVSDKDQDGNTPLHIAARYGHLDIVIYLIEDRKCDPECPGKYDRTPLHYASEKSLAIVKYLVETHGCDPSTSKDNNGDFPIHRAALSNDLDILKYLIEEKKCNTKIIGAWKRNLLHNACVVGNLATVKYLVEEHDFDIHCTDLHGFMPIDGATSSHHTTVIDYLKEKMGIEVPTFPRLLPPGSVTIRNEKTRIWSPENLSGDPVPWIHPDLQKHRDPMIPDWAPVQRWNGEIVYLNLQSEHRIGEDPRAAYERYRHALKDGSVSAYLIKIVIVGAAGVGKTHLLHLLFNEEPPKVRRSTPLMERPVQTILTALKDSIAFKKITDEELYELLGHSVNDSIKQKADSVQQSAQMATRTFVNVPVIQATVAENNTEIETGPDDNEVAPISEVEEHLVEPISKYKDAAPLSNIDWVYVIDSGGQPQFHQLLPAFMQHTNLKIFVLRLCDKLSDRPKVEYFDEHGKCISSTTSVLSNKEILQSCAQATQTKDRNCDSRLIIVGTHRDQEHLCADETMLHKNKLLRELLLPSMKDYVMLNNSAVDIVFSLNTKEPNATDMKVAEELRKAILSMKTGMKPQPIPIRWLMFHQELQALSQKMNTDQLDFQQCILVAERLHIKGDTAAALMFFSNLNVILYYPKVLPDVVFIHPQSLLNIVTCLIKYVVYGTSCTHINDPVLRKACSEGMISLQLLEWMILDVPHVYKPTMIRAQELLILLTHLGIVCKNNGDYFMPSLLKSADAKDIEILLSKHPDSVAPCAVYYENRWLDCGAFGFLITSLLSSKGWKLTLDDQGLPCVHSNIIKMYYDSSIVTFVDYVSHIEIHVNAGSICTCQDICPEIMGSVLNAFNEVKPLFAFICPCKKFQRHVTKFSSNSLKRKEIFCSREQSNTFPLSSLGVKPLVWNLKAVNVLKLNYNKIIGTVEEPDLLADLLYSNKIILNDVKDKVCNISKVDDKNRSLLDAVCGHLSSTPQDYAVFRNCALQTHPSWECLLPPEYCLSCAHVDEECDLSSKKRKNKEGHKEEQERKLKSPKLDTGFDSEKPVLLTNDDHDKVFKLTKSASGKWKTIGMALGFKYDELTSIVKEPGNTGLDDYYATMLSQWLDWAPPYHSFPCVQRLSQALYEVKKEKQALDLNKAYGVTV